MLVAGVDLGTQSLKAVIVDGDRVVGTHHVPIATDIPRPGWAEQDPRTWEAALAGALRVALAAAGRTARDISALGIAGQLDGCVAVDPACEPLHAALIWHDKRASAHVVATTFSVTGQVADPSHLAPKAAWLRANGIPAAKFHQPVSYLVARLTGVHVMDPSHASTTLLYDLTAGGWWNSALAAYRISPSQLPKVSPASSVAGTLTPRAASLLGLRAGTPVVVGTGDDFATPLGAGITRPGAIAVVLGTAEVIGGISDTLVLDRNPEPMVETHAFPTGGYFVENPGWLSGGALHWAVHLLGLRSAAELDSLAASIDTTEVLFVPALAGATAPVWRPNARGTLHGLAASHGPADIARAVLEGLAFACRDVVDRLGSLGLPTSDIYLLGGGNRSATWSQIRADILGRRHIRSRDDSCALGAAMLAGAPMPRSPHAGASFSPRRNRDDAYARYRDLVSTLLPTW